MALHKLQPCMQGNNLLSWVTHPVLTLPSCTLYKKRPNYSNQIQLPLTTPQQPPYHTFVGISGPYDIVHHYDFEAARGWKSCHP